MGPSEQNMLSTGAVLWYHEWLAERGPGALEGTPTFDLSEWGTPTPAILRQLRRRLVGRRQGHRLQKAVTGAGGETRGNSSRLLRYAHNDMMKRDVIETLRLHFGCLDEQVTCSRVKSFLPGLLAPSGPIRIPTPITVHIDQCPACAADLAALRGLGLSAEQLDRLERLYEALSDPARREPRRLCRQARAQVEAFARGALDGIDGAILNHLCTCPRCHRRVHDCRQKLLAGHKAQDAAHAPGCGDDLPPGRLFDYAVPHGRTEQVAQPPSAQESGGSPPGAGALPAHVQACPSCLTRIQTLDETVYGIVGRADSGITTIYSTVDEAEPAMASEAHELQESVGSRPNPYAEYPIEVQVVHTLPARAAAPARVKAARQETACNRQVRLLLKTAVAAAAVIALALLFRGTESASGTTLAQVYRAYEGAENVHLSRVDPRTGSLVREFWILRNMNIVLEAGGQETVWYDIGAGRAYIRRAPGEAAIEVADGARACAFERRLVDTALGWTPKDVAPDVIWTRVEDQDGAGLEAYELRYSKRTSSGETKQYKLTFTIDPATKRPREVQWFSALSTEHEWHHTETTTLEYLSRPQMKAALAQQHFDASP